MSIVSPSLMEVILRYKLLQFVKMLSLQTLHTHFSRMVYRKGHIYQHINVIHPEAIKNFIFPRAMRCNPNPNKSNIEQNKSNFYILKLSAHIFKNLSNFLVGITNYKRIKIYLIEFSIINKCSFTKLNSLSTLNYIIF